MRTIAVALLLVLVPLCAAQVPTPPVTPPATLEVKVGAFAEPLRPFGAPGSADVTVKVSCALAATNPQGGAQIFLDVPKAPAWATMVASPSVVIASADKCDAGFITLKAVVVAVATDQAPAFAKGAFTVRATAKPPGGDQSGSGDGDLTAGFYGGLSAQAKSVLLTLKPGEAGSFDVVLRNLGNARAKVSFDITATQGVQVEPLEAVSLPSAAEGASQDQTTTTVKVKVLAPPAPGFVSKSDSVTVRVSSAYEKDPTIKGQSTNVSLRVNTEQNPTPPSGEKKSPLAFEAPLVALTLAALALRRRRD